MPATYHFTDREIADRAVNDLAAAYEENGKPRPTFNPADPGRQIIGAHRCSYCGTRFIARRDLEAHTCQLG